MGIDSDCRVQSADCRVRLRDDGDFVKSQIQQNRELSQIELKNQIYGNASCKTARSIPVNFLDLC